MPAVDFTFDGDNKQIIISTGVTQVDVQDMYSRWKDWILTSDNSKYLQAFRTFGGDPTIIGQFAPRYYFLTNGWRVLVQSDQDVSLGTNLYTDELEPAFVVLSGSSVSNRNSDAVIVDNGIHDTLGYVGSVTFDENGIYNGGTWPIGTDAKPVNNISDLLLIANNYGLHQVKLRSNITITQNLSQFKFFGTYGGITLNANGFTLSECFFESIRLSGDFANSEIYASSCSMQNIDNISGIIEDSFLNGRIKISAGSSITLSHCVSIIPGLSSPQIDMNAGNDAYLNIRNYSGGISIFNCDTPNSTSTIEIVSGRLNLLSGCTDGFISARGVAYLNNQSSGTTIDTSALIVPQTLNSKIANIPDQQISTQQSINTITEVIKNKN